MRQDKIVDPIPVIVVVIVKWFNYNQGFNFCDNIKYQIFVIREIVYIIIFDLNVY